MFLSSLLPGPAGPSLDPADFSCVGVGPFMPGIILKGDKKVEPH